MKKPDSPTTTASQPRRFQPRKHQNASPFAASGSSLFAILALLSVGGVLAPLRAPAAILLWTNTAGGAWHTAGNWSPNQVPTAVDDVSITNAGTYVVTIQLSAGARSIALGGNSGGLQTLNIPGPLLVVSNQITIGPSGLWQALGTVNVFGDVIVHGEFEPSSLVLGGAGALDVTGGRLRLAGDLRISNRVVRNSGIVTASNGQLFLGDNASFTNFSSGTLVFTNNNTGIQYNGTFPNTNQFFDNQGVIRVHGNSFIAVPSAHSGTIEVLAGQLSLRRHPSFTSFAIDMTAACSIAAEGTLSFENASTEFHPPASASGAGHLRVSGGNFNLTGAYSLAGTLICQNNAVVHLNTGSPLTLPHLVNEAQADVRGSDPLTITGTLLWRNGGQFSGPAPLMLAATAQTTFELSLTSFRRPLLANAGTMNWFSADLRLDANSVFTNLPTGVIVITNAPSLQSTYLTSVGIRENEAFHNAGTIRLTSERPTEFSIPFFNTGTVRIDRNEFRMTFSATLEQHSGATELAGGTLRFFPGSNCKLYGGVLTGSGDVIGDDVENLGGIISPGTSPGQINFNQSLSLNPAGAMNIELGGTNAGTGFDQVTVANTAELSGGVLSVALANNFTPTVGMKFPFLTCAIRSGTFQSFSYPSNQLTLQLNYLANGAELEVLEVAPVLQLTPQNVTLDSGDTQTFSASGGTPPYTFAVIQNQSGGTIDAASGLYTAGPNGGIDLVRVTDSASGSVQATAVVIPFDLIISDTTPQDFLNLLTQIEGSVIMSNIDARVTLLLPALTQVGANLIVRENDALVALGLSALTNVGGVIDISANPALTNVALPSLISAGSLVDVSSNTTATAIDLGSLTSVGGSVDVSDNTSATGIDLGSLTSTGGSIDVSDNTSATGINLGSLTNVTGSVDVSGNTSATGIDLDSLTSTGGSVDVTGNTSATNIELGALTSAGSVDVSGNTAVTNIDLPSLTSAGGDVILVANTSASSVSLGSLTNVNGSLNVSDNANMTTIDLGSLETAGGSVNVSDNANMTTIDLGSLETAGGSVNVSDNPNMTTLDLGSLSTADGSVNVSDNANMTTIDLSSLQSAGGDITLVANTSASSVSFGSLTNVDGSVSIDSNASLTSIDLGSAATIGGEVSIDSNGSLTSLDLSSATSVGGDVSIDNNGSLTSIDLGSLSTVDGNVSVSDNTSASSIDLSGLSVVSGTVSVSSNTAASSIDLGSLTTVDGTVSIDGNTSATGVDLGSLETVGGSLSIDGNTSATGISLTNLTTVDGTVSVSDNTSASSIDLSGLSVVSGTVSVSSNTAASSIDLGSLTTVDGTLSIDGNTSTTTIDLSSVSTVGGTVSIDGNTSTTSLDLSLLETVGGSLSIDGNTSTTTIDLSSLTNVTGNLVVTSNAPDSTVSFGSLSRIGDGTNTMAIDLRGGTFAFASGLTVPTNVVLTGFGTLAGSVTNAGKISPGASAGELDINGHLLLANSSDLRLEIGGYTPGAEFDFLGVTSSVTLGGTLSVSLINQFERVMTNGAIFTVLTAGDPVTGAFANVASGASLTTPDGYVHFTVRYAGETAVRLTGVLVDTDDDGMADWWEDQFGFSKTNPADGVLDFDTDGASNAEEFAAGTLPDNATSVFRILSLRREGDDVRLTWTTVGGKSYRVQTSAAVDTPFADFSPLIVVPGAGESTTNRVDSGAATNAAGRYYRVRLGP